MMGRLQGLLGGMTRRLTPPGSADGFCSATPVTGRDLGNYFAQVRTNYAPVSNTFQYYRYLIDQLRELDGIRLVPLQELMTADATGQRVIALRHDVDADPVTALRCSRYLARYGICGSFYLLHTAIYYGEFYGTCFVRTAPLAGWIQGLIVAGAEIGLHNDALGVCLFHGLDGIAHLRGEIEWFHALGVRIKGTVAHNSGPIYGAENFEVFRGAALWPRDVRTEDGHSLPLNVLDPQSLGLTYEGTFARRKPNLNDTEARAFFSDKASAGTANEAWMRRYLTDNPCCDWGPDAQFWLIGKDRWVLAGRDPAGAFFEWETDLEHVIDRIRSLPAGSRSVFVLHPEIVGGGG